MTLRYDELSDTQKKAARQAWVDDNRDYPYDDWWAFDDFLRVAELLGIEIGCRNDSARNRAIYFSGFGSQGDGACFAGSYKCASNAVKDIAEYAPTDKTLIDLAGRLAALQVKAKLVHDDQLVAQITTSGRYSHSGTMEVSVQSDSTGPDPEICGDDAKELTACLREFADWMYAQLEEQYDWHFSDEALDEILSDKTFDENGSII